MRRAIRRLEAAFPALAAAAVLFVAPAPPARAANVAFGPQQVIGTANDGAMVAVGADVDGDGDLDVVAGSELDNEIAWYENTDGAGTFGPQQLITNLSTTTRALAAADIDRDGDVDVLSGSYGSDTVAWYENTDGAGTFGPQQVITTLADGCFSVLVADVDGDGDPDVASASSLDDEIAWYRNDDGAGSAWTRILVSTAANLARSVHAADLDRDGDMDLLSASESDDEVAWYRNDDGAGGAWTRFILGTANDGPRSVSAADLDRDGDLDVLAASMNDDEIAWYENTDGAATFGLQQLIGTSADFPVAVSAADVDLDGDLDVLSASVNDDEVMWHENTDGAGGAWQPRTIAADGDSRRYAAAVDVDGDGDLDVLAASQNDDEVAWYENRLMHRNLAFGPMQTIDHLRDDPREAYAADLDRDGDADVLSASSADDTVAWQENLDGQGSFGPPQVLSNAAGGARSVLASDLDRDGDLDAVWGAETGGSAWHENTDGAGSFGPPVSIGSGYADSVTAADVDRDGDEDILESGSSSGRIRRNDGAASFPIAIARASEMPFAEGDFDGDGDLDLALSLLGGYLVWTENLDGAGTFTFSGNDHLMLAGFGDPAIAARAADYDADGDVDILYCDTNHTVFGWNDAGPGSSWGFSQFPSSSCVGLSPTGDLDRDGDLDIALVDIDSNIRVWSYSYPEPASTVIDGSSSSPESAFPADLDGDGDLDLVTTSSITDRIAWHENVGGQYALSTADAAPAAAGTPGLAYEGTAAPVLRIDVTSHGRPGDAALHFVSYELRFETDTGAPLTSAQLDALVGLVNLHLDDGDGVFDAGDPWATGYLAPSLVDGVGVVSVLSFLETQPGQTTRYFVTLDIDAGASAQAVDRIRVVHRSAGSTARDAVALSTLDQAPSADVSSGVIWAVTPTSDGDGDGIPDVHETNTGNFVSATNTGTNPLAADSDGDFELDLAEIGANTDPNDGWDFSDRSFSAPEVAAGGLANLHFLEIARIDADSRGDIVATRAGELFWLRNTGVPAAPWDPKVTLHAGSFLAPPALDVADIDGEGDPDVVWTLAYVTPAIDQTWWRNDGGSPVVWSQVGLPGCPLGMAATTGQVGGSPEPDVLLIRPLSPTLATLGWCDATGPHDIATFAFDAGGDLSGQLLAANLDADPEAEVVSALGQLDEVTVWNHVGGGVWSGYSVPVAIDAVSMATADLDGDTFLDLIVADRGGDALYWLPNYLGDGMFPTAVWLFGIDGPVSVLSGDVDGDTDVDLVVAAEGAGSVFWLDNYYGDGTYFDPRPLDGEAAGVRGVALGDVDGDGAADVAATIAGADEIRWYRNETSPACSNGLDDDGDGKTDHPADGGCTDPTDPSERQTGRICDDGVDDDGDLLADFPADPGCASETSIKENPKCNDGIDNDGDNLVDLADPGCSGFASNDFEVPPSGCGLLGIEACIVLGAWGSRARRRRGLTNGTRPPKPGQGACERSSAASAWCASPTLE